MDKEEAVSELRYRINKLKKSATMSSELTVRSVREVEFLAGQLSDITMLVSDMAEFFRELEENDVFANDPIRKKRLEDLARLSGVRLMKLNADKAQHESQHGKFFDTLRSVSIELAKDSLKDIEDLQRKNTMKEDGKAENSNS